MWNKNEAEGKAEEIKGAIKNKVGEITGDRELEEEGEAEEIAGELQHEAGTVQRKAGEAIEKVGRTIAGN